LCLIRQYATNMYGREEVWLHIFLTSELGEWSALDSGRITFGERARKYPLTKETLCHFYFPPPFFFLSLLDSSYFAVLSYIASFLSPLLQILKISPRLFSLLLFFLSHSNLLPFLSFLLLFHLLLLSMRFNLPFLFLRVHHLTAGTSDNSSKMSIV
jgi:hypothetical protein